MNQPNAQNPQQPLVSSPTLNTLGLGEQIAGAAGGMPAAGIGGGQAQLGSELPDEAYFENIDSTLRAGEGQQNLSADAQQTLTLGARGAWFAGREIVKRHLPNATEKELEIILAPQIQGGNLQILTPQGMQSFDQQVAALVQAVRGEQERTAMPPADAERAMKARAEDTGTARNPLTETATNPYAKDDYSMDDARAFIMGNSTF